MDITQTIEGSKLLRWFANEGDKIGPGKPICEVETPDLLFSLESEDEGHRLSLLAAVHKKSSTAITASDSTPTDGADLLRVLSHLHKEGAFPSEDVYKTLKSLARKNDEQLLLVYKGSFEEDNTTSGFDKDFFVENCVDLVDEKTHEGTPSS
ncbi:hypothetical protein DYB37_003461 [Aphanomyces astaci]|uniref:Lipoyl-binding domain-containing protein n=1 Tax=Aphanomyces astaci TaxID=112090 RepID=A0A397BHD2_APHAT|nr:hypothetical protein DYB36_009607 [Aphanomyces astaci]RHY95486.1 hypothetical protein DYB35_003462 [Aphanomyces astaci]RHZ34284.1 hypothetical protein DYB37_003461 [Aphanomyces astaci]